MRLAFRLWLGGVVFGRFLYRFHRFCRLSSPEILLRCGVGLQEIGINGFKSYKLFHRHTFSGQRLLPWSRINRFSRVNRGSQLVD